MIVNVERKSQFGILYQEKWYNISKQGATCTIADFEQGKSYDVEGAVSGKSFYIKSMKPVGGQPQATPTSQEPVKNNYDEAKNKRILRQGIYQAVLVSPAVASFVTTKDTLVEVVSEIAEALIKKVEG